MRERNIQINKFTRGIVRDGVDDPDFLRSMRNIQNYDIDYTRGQLRKRNGYQRYNLTALSSDPQQVYVYCDLSGNENVLVVTDTKLYVTSDAASNTEVKNGSVSPSTSLSFTGGEKYPFVTLDDGRCVFADNNDVYWCDNTSLSNNECYQLGMDRPDDELTFTAYTNPQQTNSTGSTQLTHKLAQSFTCPTYKLYVDIVQPHMNSTGTVLGLFRLRIETDNAGEPSGELVFEDAQTEWFDFSDAPASNWVNGYLINPGWLDADTTYWMVLEGGSGYSATQDGSNHLTWNSDNTNPYANGKAISYNGSVWSDIATTDMRFRVGYWPLSNASEVHSYKYSLYNNTYTTESELSKEIMVTLPSINAVQITLPTVADGQATHVNFYRKTYDSDNDSYSDDYYFAGRGAVADSEFVDVRSDSKLVDIAQSTNFQRPIDTDGNAIVPKYIANWRSRLWLVKENDRTVYYSMRLGDDGALGYTGFSLYDAFYTENFEQLDTLGEPITGILPLKDQLAVYTDTHIIPIFGCNSTLNPMDDLAPPERFKENVGCVAPSSLVSTGDHHYFVSRRGIEQYDGNEVTSISFNPARGLYIQSMVDAWEDKASVFGAITVNDEYWLVADEEGIIRYEEEIYDEEYYAVPSTQIVYIYDLIHQNWRTYQYYHTMNHIHAPLHGSLAGTILLCPQEDYTEYTWHIMKTVSSVYSDRDDNNTEISVAGLIETQDLRPLTSEMPYNPRRWLSPPTAWHHVVVDDYQSGSPVYTFKVRDKDSNVEYADLSITTDPRSKRAGLRINSDACRFRIRQISTTADEIRSIIAEWTER